MKRNIILLMLVILSLSVNIVIGDDGKILASVNGMNITEIMLQNEMEKLPKYLRSELDNGVGRSKLLYGIIVRELLFQEAIRLGIDNNMQSSKENEYQNKLNVIRGLLASEHIQKYIDMMIKSGDIDNSIRTDKEKYEIFIKGLKNKGKVRIFDGSGPENINNKEIGNNAG